MKTIASALFTLAFLGTAACAATPGTPDALPAGSSDFPTTSAPAYWDRLTDDVANADKVTTTTTPEVVEVADASSCDVAREALLTGSAAEIRAAMVQLKADRTADATAREYADEYLTETNASLQDMNVSLIRMACL